MSRLLDHFKSMQGMASRFLEPTAYVRTYPNASGGPGAMTQLTRNDFFISDLLHMLDGPEQRRAVDDHNGVLGAFTEEVRKRLDAEVALQRLVNMFSRGDIVSANPETADAVASALTLADQVLEHINEDGPLPDLQHERVARSLRIALAEGFAPRIEDPQAMRWAKGLQHGLSEGAMELTHVPINVVYSAMFAFAKAFDKEDTLG